MGEAVSFSFCHAILKEPSLCVIVGWRVLFLVLKGKFVAIAEGGGSFAEGTDPALIIGCLGDVFPGAESFGFGEGVKLFESGVVEGRAMGLDKGTHCL